MGTDKARQFFEDYIGGPATEFRKLAQSGSARENFLAKTDKKTYIVTANQNYQENEAFLYFSKIFADQGLNTPKIEAVNPAEDLYIQEFLGEHTLSDIIANEGLSQRVQQLVKETLYRLFLLQQSTQGKIDYTQTFEYQHYNKTPILNDLFYFKNFFVDILELPYQKARLTEEFLDMADTISQLQPKGIMLRDFQARNIMVDAQDDVFFIDYQSAMEGPPMYDVISFLYQAKANFPEDFRQNMLNFYINQHPSPESRQQLHASIPPLMLVRFLQVMGAYGFRGLVQRKAHFLASISGGIYNLLKFSENYEFINTFPELKKLIRNFGSEEIQHKIGNLNQIF